MIVVAPGAAVVPAAQVALVETVTGTVLTFPALSKAVTVYVVVWPAVRAVDDTRFPKMSIDSGVVGVIV